MIVEKGLEQRFRAFFQFIDYLGNRATAPVKGMESPRKRIDAGRREFACM